MGELDMTKMVKISQLDPNPTKHRTEHTKTQIFTQEPYPKCIFPNLNPEPEPSKD